MGETQPSSPENNQGACAFSRHEKTNKVLLYQAKGRSSDIELWQKEDHIVSTSLVGIVYLVCLVFCAARYLLRKQKKCQSQAQKVSTKKQLSLPGCLDAKPQGEPEWWLELSDYHSILDSEAPDDERCPITLQVMRRPVILLETGNTFEHTALYKWVKIDGKRADPRTRECFSEPYMVKNSQLERKIRARCENRFAELKRTA
jgi:hypothetical protein